MELTRPTGDFNLNALPADEKLRKLMFIATSGSDVMLTPYAATGNGETIQEKQKREDRAFYDAMVGAIASRERVEQFHVEMKEVDVQRSELLDRIKEELQRTRFEIKRLREAAPEVALADGRRVKVYRDFDDVRTESGELIDSAIVKADAVSSDTRNFLKTKHAIDKESRLMALQGRSEARRKQDRDAQIQADEGKMSAEDLEKHTATSRNQVADDKAAFEKLLREPPGLKERTLETSVVPTSTFNGAADRAFREEVPLLRPEEIKPAQPSASAPVPR